jgi:hypothetical protein
MPYVLFTQIHVEILSPKVMVLGGRALDGLMIGIGGFVKET